MSYPRDIDEYTDTELMGELMGRANRREAGRCDYCDQHRDKPSCRFPSRHSQAMTKEERKARK